MLKILFLFLLAATLVVFLLWRGTPRPILFEALFNSAWLFTIAFFVGLNLFNKFFPMLLDGLVPCLLPIIPVVAFNAWFLPRAKVIKR
jgi:hypothetical protein